MQCYHIPGKGFLWGSYECRCKPQHYQPDRNATNTTFNGRDIELAYLEMIKNESLNYTKVCKHFL